ncbi:putative 2-(5''-triphosphoribosyl)-3'-dephosphocoenzyme-A synthase [Neoroseomonas lacus]|uniref:Probable 2-(5''-triphosphoribosyl)-3'-dephosphocoenzyme-A synthase n=2 Tax=Neoroseomonas lacus TaxID=287609 RepID=A0A917KBF2_9PROT|nr:putative 2-(5''-triphosphoribosyl)-3'-dephosphocoenzyme-A synthase [Neoroseomonas lacus]
MAAPSRRLAAIPPRPEASRLIADCAVDALLKELDAWPKPGLVSRIDSGSHKDMDADMLAESAEALRPFFAELALAGQAGAAMGELRAIGLRAETAMLAATGGVNTHRGAIFGLGLLCAAAGQMGRAIVPSGLGEVVRRCWGHEIMRGPVPLFSHGTAALRQYGAGGARAEAASGFRSVHDIGLPALRRGRALQPKDRDAAAVHACFALIARVQDTNLLHRGGVSGQRMAATMADFFLRCGGVGNRDWRARATAAHAVFVALGLSPGGCADLLAMTLFVDTVGSLGGLDAPQ